MINKEQAHYLILVLYTIALADNDFHGAEEEYIETLGAKYGLAKDEVDHIIANPHKVRQIDPDSKEERLLFAYSMSELLCADKKVDPREVNALRRFMDLLGLSNIDELSAIMIDSVLDGTSFEAFIEDA